MVLEKYGASVDVVRSELGDIVSPAAVAAKLEQDTRLDYKAVFATHNETSTGVTNDIKQIAAAVKNHPALFVVDAISSFGAIKLDPAWGIDLVLMGSQKALMSPPGLAFVAVGKSAWDLVGSSKSPRFYFDLQACRKYAEKGQTPYTPAVSLFYAIEESLRLIKEEGFENVFERHKKLGSLTRETVSSMGLELFATNGASDVITAVKVPFNVDVNSLLSLAREKHNVVFAGGQKELSGRIFRIGHIGYVTEEDILLALDVLKRSLSECGFVR